MCLTIIAFAIATPASDVAPSNAQDLVCTGFDQEAPHYPVDRYICVDAMRKIGRMRGTAYALPPSSSLKWRSESTGCEIELVSARRAETVPFRQVDVFDGVWLVLEGCAIRPNLGLGGSCDIDGGRIRLYVVNTVRPRSNSTLD